MAGKTESPSGMGKQEDSDDQASPRGVLEVPISSSDFENISINSRSGSCGLSIAEKSTVRRDLFQESHGVLLHWRNLFENMKWKSVRRFSAIPSRSGNKQSRKNLIRKLGRNHSANHEISGGDMAVPEPSLRNFSHAELAAATDYFSSEKLIGKGGHAEVYKGCLADGQIVAVKRIIITRKEKEEENRVGDFLSELGIIAHIHHPNAAKLVGFSADGGLHLVLQFSPHGSLSSVLHGGGKSVLDWKRRLRVAIGVAEGLQYLHCECQRRIIHRDISSSNILLTQDYEPQISDFGLGKWLPEKWTHHVVHPIEGTFGYMAPEYFNHGIVDEKIDVFAFGVLLLELVTGRRAINSHRQNLVMWAKPLLQKNSVKDIADPRLGDAYDIGEMKLAMLTALSCLHPLPTMRPNMNQIVQLLRGEGGEEELKMKSLGGGEIMLDAYDWEDYTCTTYLNDLKRHRQLALE